MKRFLNLFTSHPNSIGETYWQHFLSASKISARLGIACLSQFTHAVLPFIHPPFGSDTRSLTIFLKKSESKNRSKLAANIEDLNDNFGSD